MPEDTPQPDADAERLALHLSALDLKERPAAIAAALRERDTRIAAMSSASVERATEILDLYKQIRERDEEIERLQKENTADQEARDLIRRAAELTKTSELPHCRIASLEAELEQRNAEIERLTQERDDYRADYIRLHKDKCDLLDKYVYASPSQSDIEQVRMALWTKIGNIDIVAPFIAEFVASVCNTTRAEGKRIGEARGYAGGVEDAARLIEDHTEIRRNGPAGTEAALTEREPGTLDGLTYAAAIRALSPKPREVKP